MNKSRVFIVLICSIIAGCAAPKVVRNYDGPKRADDEIAILLHNTETGIKIFEVDEKYVLNRLTTWNPDAWQELELIPGEHILSGGLYLTNRYAIFRETFFFSPGKRYKVVYEVIDNSNARFSLVEIE